MENPIQMDDLGVPLFSETSISWRSPTLSETHDFGALVFWEKTSSLRVFVRRASGESFWMSSHWWGLEIQKNPETEANPSYFFFGGSLMILLGYFFRSLGLFGACEWGWRWTDNNQTTFKDGSCQTVMIKTEINQLDVYSNQLKNPLKIISQNLLLHEVVGLNQGMNVQKHPKSSLKDRCLRNIKWNWKTCGKTIGLVYHAWAAWKKLKSNLIQLISHVGIFWVTLQRPEIRSFYFW